MVTGHHGQETIERGTYNVAMPRRDWTLSKSRLAPIVVSAILVSACCSAEAPEKDPSSPPQIPFERYFMKDEFGRRITFYLERKTATTTPLPIALFILGSGASSNFLIREGRTLHAHRAFLKALEGRARLLVVEKVGVSFGGQPERPGTATGSSEEFRREHTFERWVAANSAAVAAARGMEGVDRTRTLVAGHSEGALVAAGVAARNTFVTHVACLAGGGATQLFSFFQEARAGRLESLGATPDEQMARLIKQWRDIIAHRDNPNRMWLGHAYPRWATFMSTSVVEQLVRTKASIFVGMGSKDGIDPAASVDLAHASLLAVGNNDVTAVLVPGANHGFQFPDDPTRDGWGRFSSV
jgi:pimeloyl-ACP methyl ester carboxylesterase